MARLPEETLARIKAEVPLETLCREHAIELTGSGKNLLGKCPFHEDGEPSFVVTPGKNPDLYTQIGHQIPGGGR